jgi:hypothetical protein
LIKHVVLIHYVRETDITGGGNFVIYEPFTRMVTLSIRAEDWSHALEKPSHLNPFKRNELIKFKMTTTFVDLKFGEQRYIASKAKFEQALKMMVGKYTTLKEITDAGGLDAYSRQTCTIWTARETA